MIAFDNDDNKDEEDEEDEGGRGGGGGGGAVELGNTILVLGCNDVNWIGSALFIDDVDKVRRKNKFDDEK